MDARQIIDIASRLAFAGASLVLMLMSCGLIVLGGWEVISGLSVSFSDTSTALLAAIGYVVIAMAVFDVAKYFIEEEVTAAARCAPRPKRGAASPSSSRRSRLRCSSRA